MRYQALRFHFHMSCRLTLTCVTFDLNVTLHHDKITHEAKLRSAESTFFFTLSY